MSVVEAFEDCLADISHYRAGWCFYLPPEQRRKEAAQAREAIDRARSMWTEHPDMHDELRAVFRALCPLVTMDEIDRGVSSHGSQDHEVV